MKRILLVALAATALFASCSKSDEGGDSAKGETAVYVTLNEAVVSRAGMPETGQIADGSKVVFGSGRIYFISSSGRITKFVDIIPGSGNYDETAATVGLDALKTTGGTKITNVPDNSTSMYVVGNTGSITLPAVGAFLADIKKLVVTVQSQANLTSGKEGNVDNVTLFGGTEDNIGTHPTITNDKYAKVKVYPIAARIELQKITQTGSILTKFQVDGIFINHFYKSVQIDNTMVANSLEDFGSDVAKYLPAGYAGYEGLFSYDAAGIGKVENKAFTAVTANNVFAYNLVVPKTGDIPHIVVRLSNIEPTSFTNPQFLTITKFKKSDDTYVDSFKPGVIYRITNINFDETNLTDRPEVESINVWAEVELGEWEVEEVTGEF